MIPDDRKRALKRDLAFAAMLAAAGVAISVLSLGRIMAGDPQQIAQATPPTQSTPGSETKPPAPPEPGTTGQRPHEIPPQPARPDPEAQKRGAQPALPPAPAEKVAPPVREK
ncbi:hypothetical protein J6524_12910 [Bradyrhizobium sp. WSM 1738]|nr:hypothetical protein [Bradyrhizobium hereditatis]